MAHGTRFVPIERASWLGAAALCLMIGLSWGCRVPLQDVTAGHIGCRPDEIVISDNRLRTGVRTWTATCAGRQYVCSAVATGKDDGQIDCSPMGGGGASYAQPVLPGGRVERAFDQARGLHVLFGIFALHPNLELRLVGVPQADMGTIAVQLVGAFNPSWLGTCPGLEVAVNAVPFRSDKMTVSYAGTGYNLESRFGLATFTPLAQQFSSFGVGACGYGGTLNDTQMSELQKFLAIYSQLAAEVQSGQLPAPSTAAQTAGGETPAAAPPIAAPASPAAASPSQSAPAAQTPGAGI